MDISFLQLPSHIEGAVSGGGSDWFSDDATGVVTYDSWELGECSG